MKFRYSACIRYCGDMPGSNEYVIHSSEFSDTLPQRTQMQTGRAWAQSMTSGTIVAEKLEVLMN